MDLFILFLSFLIRSATASPQDHVYKVGDPVPLFVNKVGPLNNPSETYWYYDLPFCRPDRIIKNKETFGEVLNGDRLTNAQYLLSFREDKNFEPICKKTLSEEEVIKFRDAVKKDYYYQMYFDDLPVWGFIGKVEGSLDISNETEPRYYLFKNIQFNVLYNHKQIIEITAFSDPNYAVDITEDIGTVVEFTYSARWDVTLVPFESRMDKYLKISILPQHLKVHWFTIINSIVVVLLLIGFLATLFFRTLRNDLIKNSQADQLDDKEVGWKYIHGDVFRYPPHKPLLCAVLATGTQLPILILVIFVLTFLGVFYPYNRGVMFTSLVMVYAVTSAVAGYISSSFHIQCSHERILMKNVLLTSIVFPAPLFFTISVLNTVATFYNATNAFTFGTILSIILIWIFVTFPFLLLGHVIGRVTMTGYQAPCTIKRIPTEIPPLPWYQRTLPQMFLAGLLPFGAIFTELHYIFTSLWGHKIYIIFSILIVIFIILIIITVLLSIVLTYFQLAAEDHEWWWRSVLCGGSTSIFVYGYCCYFYAKSDMTGLLQFAFFFGYNACICYAFFLMLGTIAFFSSLRFIHHLYSATKIE